MLEWMTKRIGGVDLRLTAAGTGLRSIEFSPEHAIEGIRNPKNVLLLETERQLRAYFSGGLRDFDLPLDMVGTDFQQRVWRELLKIPYGETRSYMQIASGIGSPTAVRAVGAANGANPVPIVVPCHRVIGSGGRLVGYGGGLPLKQRLLALERGSLFEEYES
jgi:methylated-DNA-[protein]-cysteine S-methyltransferase